MQEFKSFLARSQRYLVNGEFKKAIREVKTALNIDPSQFLGWVTLSSCYFNIGKIDKSIETVRNVMKFNSRFKERTDILTAAFQYAKDSDKLIESLKKALTNPTSFKGEWTLVGGYYLSKKEYDKAIEAYKLAIKQHPDWPSMWLNLSAVYIEMEEFDNVIETAKKALQIKHDFKFALLHLGIAHFKKGDKQEALKICEQILRLDPLFEEMIKLQSKILKEMGKSTINDENPIEIYEGIELRKDQKEVLFELEKLSKKPIKPQVRINALFSTEAGFVARAGYIVELGLTFAQHIPESIANLKYLKVLEVPFSMTELPENIVKLQNLKRLLFIPNFSPVLAFKRQKAEQIYLDKKICQLKGLKILNIRDSSTITHLPECLGHLPNLQEINVGNCHNLYGIPESIKINFKPEGDDFRLKLIRRTPNKDNSNEGWEHSKFIKTPGPRKPLLTPYTHPRAVNLKFERKNLPEKEIMFLERLEKSLGYPITNQNTNPRYNRGSFFRTTNDTVSELCIGGSRIMTEIPETISCLTNLERLTINASSKLKTITAQIGKLSSLKYLSVHGKVTLPYTIGKLKNLEEVIFAHCSIPQSFTKLSNIRLVKVNNCQDFNNLTNFNNLQSLKHLNISEINHLPINLGDLPNLKTLNLLMIREVKKLPESLGRLSSLEQLTISHCREIMLVPNTIGSLKNLKKLEIQACPKISHLPESIKYLESLQDLNIENCNFKTLPQDLKNFKNLKTVSILGNPISPRKILDKYEHNLLSEEEVLHQLMFIIEFWKEVEKDFCGRGDVIIDYENIRVTAIQLLHNLMMNRTSTPTEQERFYKLFEKIISSDNDIAVRDAALESLIKLYPKKSKDSLNWVIKNESSFLLLKNLYNLLKQYPELTEFWKRLRNRFCSVLNISAKELEGILPFFFFQIIEDFHFKFDEAMLRQFAINSISTVKENKDRKTFYAIDEGHVIALNISGFGFMEIPDFIKHLTRLQYLNVSHNQITSLPPKIAEFEYLKEIDLSYNKFTTYPSLPKQIKRINISHNPLKSVPKEILEGFIKEYINYRIDIKDVEVLAYLKLVFGLTLTQISSISEVLNQKNKNCYILTDKSNIRGLFINDPTVNGLMHIPDVINQLKYLEFLDISNHPSLTTVPKALSSLKNLTYLKLYNNNLSEFPLSALELLNLEYLNLGSNMIHEVPKDINHLSHLKTLDLSFNKIKKIPKKLFGINSLVQLNFDGNEINEIYSDLAQLKDLQELYLGFNNLSTLPDELTKLTALKKLSICGNKVSCLPSTIGNLKNLIMLNVSGNTINEIPDSIAHLPQLEYLDLSENTLESVPDSIADIDTLKHFNLSYNNMNAPSPKINNIKGFIFKRKLTRNEFQY